MELLSPAGNYKKLQYAIHYGADAIYTAGKNFSLRAQSDNLSEKELKQATEFCHSLHKKIYVAVNIFAHNSDLEDLPSYLEFLQKIKIDAIIISDPGIFLLSRKHAPEVPIHISTQANVTSWKSAEFWQNLGTKRIILARELTISEIKEIRSKLPALELEMFVHGAMCMSYSGRCLLSSFLNRRSANRGNCTQPCRWKYNLVEETRPEEYFPIEEDKYGTYILNSKDLCLFDRLAEIKKSGINSIKIEGRMKSIYYVANLTRTYKEALACFEENQNAKEFKSLKSELDKISHRVYTEAFFDEFDASSTQNYSTSSYIRKYQFIGEIIKTEKAFAFINCKGKISLNDEIEIIFPKRANDIVLEVANLFDEDGNPISFTKPNTVFKIDLKREIPEFGIVRKKI